MESATALIGVVWPEYAEQFSREVQIYRSHYDVFRPFFALAQIQDEVIGFSPLTASMIA